MTTANVSDKGQITIPARLRKRLGIKPGARVEIEDREDGLLIKPIKSISELSGAFHEYAKGKPTDWETIRAETYRIMAEEYVKEHGL